MFAVARQPFKVNAYIDQDILHEHEHERLQIDLPQVDFCFYKKKSTCSTCSDRNLKINLFKYGCDVMIHKEVTTDMYKIIFQDFVYLKLN